MEASNLPFEDDFVVLPKGATDEERRKNCEAMEAKKRVVQDAIDNPKKLPETIALAKRRVKWLDKQRARERRMLAESRRSDKTTG